MTFMQLEDTSSFFLVEIKVEYHEDMLLVYYISIEVYASIIH
jgi:hypothetical protein